MIQSIANWLAGDTNGLIFTIFLCLALGYVIGNVKVGIISLGATVGSLLVGVIVSIALSGYVTYDIPMALRSLFFDLFIFAVGYAVGPAFVKSLKTSGLKLIAMAVSFSVIAFIIGVVCYLVFRLEPGELAGLFAGAMTQSTILGAAQSVMTSLGISGDAADLMNSQMTAAFAVGYMISYAGCVILIKTILPIILGCKDVAALKDKVAESARKTGFKGDEAKGSVYDNIRLRTFMIESGSKVISMTVGAFQDEFLEHVQVETLMRQDSQGSYAPVSDFSNDTVFQEGDVIALIGDLEDMPELSDDGLKEVTDQKFQKVVIVKDIMTVTKPISAEALAEMYKLHVMPVSAMRDGSELTDLSSFKHGDIVTLIGSKARVSEAIAKFGYHVDTSEDTDVSFMGLGMTLGILLGIATITVAAIPISFGVGGGIMLLGIFCGWYNDRHPERGHISSGALWLMKAIGLNVYAACLGLTSGASFITALETMGINMIFALVIMAFLPHILTVLFGKYVLKLDTVELLGGTCGSGTNTAALNGLIDETGSSIFATAYTPAYAMANISLTFLGTLAITFFH